MSYPYNRLSQRARQRALRRLAALHAEEFDSLNIEERAKLGLAPPDPAKWSTAATVDPECHTEPVVIHDRVGLYDRSTDDADDVRAAQA